MLDHVEENILFLKFVFIIIDCVPGAAGDQDARGDDPRRAAERRDGRTRGIFLYF